MTELTQRIAALSPVQREMLLRELAREGAAAPGPDLSLPKLVPRPAESFEPFPLTEVQEVYWAGRSGLFDLGTPGANVYLEYELPGAEPYLDLLQRALGRLCELHPMLRAVMLPDGRQQIREEIPPIQIERADLRDLPPDEVDAAIAAAAERFRYHPGEVGQWPLFGFLAQLLDGARIRLHVWFDAWLIDGMSRNHLMADLQRIVSDPEVPLRPLPCTYRDYALTCEAIRGSEAWRRARAWWLERIPALPPPPELPLAVPLGPRVPSRFVHRVAPLLAPDAWTRFQAQAARRSLTASPALMAAFVEVIRTWSRQPRFSFSLEGTWYPPVHPGLSEIVGNFNTIYVAVADEPRGPFAERARRLQEQVTDILDHRAFTGFQVLRELQRQRGGSTRAQMPVNFNNLVDHPGAEPATNPPDQSDPTDPPDDQLYTPRELDLGLNPPQMLMMPSVYQDEHGALGCKLQAVEDVFPPGLIQDLWGTYTRLLERLADDEALWDSTELGLTPAAHLDRRASSRPAPEPLSRETLVSLVAARAAARPRAEAVSADGRTLSQGELWERARRLAGWIRSTVQSLGATPGEPVAVLLDGGWQQPLTILAALVSGAPCLPLDGHLSAAALRSVLRRAGVRLALGRTAHAPLLDQIEGLRWRAVDGEEAADGPLAEPKAEPGDPAFLAQSDAGWAVVEHGAATTSLLDLVRRLDLKSGDRVLSLSPAAFDLALWETLAPLAAGAVVVLPAAGDRDPASWAGLAARRGTTVWSAPPALLERVVSRLPERARPRSLRLVLLARDTVPVSLPGRLRRLAPGARIASLSGFPEAPFAAAVHELGEPPADAIRVPAGVAAAPHTLHVLDAELQPRPDWVPGELWIGGPGLARGYWRDEEAAAGRFLIHPRTGERLFRTGHVARFLPGGEIDILGREDEHTVDLFGYPAEPRRTEAALERLPGVRAAAVSPWPGPDGRLRLAAWVVPAPGTRLDEAALTAALHDRLPPYLVPAALREIDELPLTPQGAVDRAALPPVSWEAPPPDPLEDELGRLAGEILGTAPLHPGDDFFAHGGTSFTAVLLLTRVRERWGDERDLTAFLYDATPRHLARLVRSGPLRRATPATTAEIQPAPRRGLLPALPPITGMKAFLVLWFGQFVSGFGSGLGAFSLGVWLFERSGSTTQFAMAGFFVISLNLIITPVAGVLADRMDRRRLIALGDTCAAVMTLLMAYGLWSGQMQPWHVFIIAPLMSAFSAIQGPATIAIVSSLVPRSQLTRATGLSQMIGSLSSIICPMAAGALIGLIGYHGVILIDFATFLVGVATLFLIRIPRPRPVGPTEGKRTFRSDILFGLSYLRERPGLLGLLGLFAFTNFGMGIVQVLLTPLLLSFATPLELGTVNSAGAVGIFLGAAILGVWGGPRIRVWGIFWFMILQGLILLLGGLRPSIPLIAGAAFVYMLAGPIVGGCNQAIWQSKVDLGIQGRVMAARILVAGTTLPLAYLIAGPLADRVFEPLLAPGGALAGSVGQLIGVGPGRGVGFLFMVLGIFIALTICLSFLNPRLRRVESELPDALREEEGGEDQSASA